MALQIQDVSSVPVDLIVALGLTAGVIYRLENTGSNFIRYADFDDQPNPNTKAPSLEPGERDFVKFGSGEKLWVWSPSPGDKSYLAVNEAIR